ncbi:MAG: DUF3575 domain-containing protein [Bacteroidia bacterium]|nr:MAG: DUF3575 domain-containing protein [Bacteroidia bacterium]
MISLAFLLLASPVSAQGTGGEEGYRFTIKTNPLSALGGPFWFAIVPLTGEYKVFFEAAVSEKSSVQVGAGYIGPSLLLNLDDLSSSESETGEITGIKTNGFRVQGMYRYFISRDLSAPEGFYVGPHVSYATAQIKNKADETTSVKGTKLNINGLFGYQLITSGGFTLDIYTGMGFVSRKWEIMGTDWDQDTFKDKASVSIPFGFSFGYAF